MNKNTLQGQIFIPSACYQMTAGRIASKLLWINQEYSSVIIIIPPWVSSNLG
jgi:hypothetical protein